MPLSPSPNRTPAPPPTPPAGASKRYQFSQGPPLLLYSSSLTFSFLLPRWSFPKSCNTNPLRQPRRPFALLSCPKTNQKKNTQSLPPHATRQEQGGKERGDRTSSHRKNTQKTSSREVSVGPEDERNGANLEDRRSKEKTKTVDAGWERDVSLIAGSWFDRRRPFRTS